MGVYRMLEGIARRWHKAYDLDGYRPSQEDPVSHYGQPNWYCARCEQLSLGMAWEPQTGEGLCLECYGRSEYCKRPWRNW